MSFDDQLMAGLKYDKNAVRRIFRERMMRESVIYQEIFPEGEQVGEERGRSQVARNLLREGMMEAIAQIQSLQAEQTS